MDKEETWFKDRWRPFIAWTYGVMLIFDFIVAPIVMMFLQAKSGQPITAWTPVTVAGGGMVHISMGSIITMNSYSRGKEKIHRWGARFKRTETVTEEEGSKPPC